AAAMQDDAPILHERLVTLSNPSSRAGGYGETAQGTNIANRFAFRAGDVGQGFAQGGVVVERGFHTPPLRQGDIEPHSATALWHADGTVTVWCSSQGHFALRDHCAAILGLSVSSVKIVPMEIGGGFGGKGQGGCYLEPVAAVLSRKAGQPVKLTMTRTEGFEGTGPTSASPLRAHMGGPDAGRP